MADLNQVRNPTRKCDPCKGVSFARRAYGADTVLRPSASSNDGRIANATRQLIDEASG
jgi:hypothetical protein